MKAPKRNTVQPTVIEIENPLVTKEGITQNKFSFENFMTLAESSADVAKSVMDYAKEKEVTNQVREKSATEIKLGEQELQKATLKHQEEMEKLKIQEMANSESHEQEMIRLSQEAQKLDLTKEVQLALIKQLEETENLSDEKFSQILQQLYKQ